MPAHTELSVPAPTAADHWRLVLLGLPRLTRDDPASSLRLSPKDAALLALVALDGPVAADHVAALLWPAVEGHKANTSLRQRLFRLRRECGANVVTAGSVLQLAPGVYTDLSPTLACIASDTEAGRDELLGDLDFDDQPELAAWARMARSRWREQRDAAIATAAARCEASGAIARGLAYAERLVDSDPLSEHAQRRLMRLHYLRGDCSAAIAAFERFEQRLKDELGARPSAETIELVATIERGAASLPAQRAIVPASLLRPPRLVGRSAESAAMAQAWASQRAFVLVGEAGIGKTRLLLDFASRAEQAVIVQARPGDGGMAYALLARLLRAVLARHGALAVDGRRQALALVLPELGDAAALAGEAQRLLLLREVDATLADASRAGLAAVIVDDLHFADDASVEFLQSLTQSESLAMLNWGFAQRSADTGPATSALHAALEEARRLESIALGPLSLAQVAELVESLALPEVDAARLAPALLKHTGGNPMFALETLKDMVLSGRSAAAGRLPQPNTVGALIERRLAQLSPAALKLARTAALAGPGFTAELAVAVLEVHPLDIAEPWRELESALVIRDGAFAHDLIFEATCASVPPPIAQLLHRRIASFLVAQGAPPASVAPHWAGAHEWALAGEAYTLAARQAQTASQRGHEVEHWQEARVCFDRAGDADRSFDARCDSIPALIVVQGVAHANGVIDALIAEAHTDRQRVAALTARAMASLMAADHQTGVAAAVQAGELARRLESPWPRFEAARLHAVGLAQGGHAGDALAVIEPFRDSVEREGSVEHKARFWSDYAYVLNTVRRLRDTAFALERAIENTRAQGDLAELATLTSNLATVKGNLGSADEALALAQRAMAIQVQLGTTDGPAGGVVETYVGLYCGMVGRYGEALERLDSAIARFERDGQKTWIAVANNHKVCLLMQLGQFARARQALSYEVPSVEWVRARGVALAARLDRALGQAGDAGLHRALELLNPGGDPHVRMQALLDEAEQLAPGLAVARCDEVLRTAETLEFGGVAMRAGLLRALALHRDGRSGEGAAQLRTLLPRLDKVVPADMYLPDAWWIAVQVFDACDASDESMMALAQGTRWIRQVALPNVPEAFRDSFLQRNPTNSALLAATGRRSR
jgi:DNA-binding SARP family transcriptional activator